MFNDLFGSDLLSAFEIVMFFTRPVNLSPDISEISERDAEILETQLEIEAKCKLTRIIRSKNITDLKISVGDLVEVFIKHANEKRGKMISLRLSLPIDHLFGTFAVPVSSGRTMNASFEDLRPSLGRDSFTLIVQEIIDTTDRESGSVLDDFEKNLLQNQPA